MNKEAGNQRKVLGRGLSALLPRAVLKPSPLRFLRLSPVVYRFTRSCQSRCSRGPSSKRIGSKSWPPLCAPTELSSRLSFENMGTPFKLSQANAAGAPQNSLASLRFL